MSDFGLADYFCNLFFISLFSLFLFLFSSSCFILQAGSNWCPAVDRQGRISFFFFFNGPPKEGSKHMMRFYTVLIWKTHEEWWSSSKLCAEKKWYRQERRKGQKGRKMEEDKKERKIPKLAWLIEQDWKQMHSRSDVIWVDLESPSGLRGGGIERLEEDGNR